MLEKVMSKIIWGLLMAGGALTIEEAVSVAYVGVPASQTICNVALGCLCGSIGILIVGGIVLGVIEVVKGLVK